jgi:putative FmdB family regulatory protein
MPTYQYECKKCGHGFEQFQRMADAPIEKCPECGGRLRRLIGTGAGVIFKGSGSRATNSGTARPSCGRDAPCCGRSMPCNSRPCDD